MTKDEALEAAIAMMISHTIREYVRKNHKVVFKKLDATIRECHEALEQPAQTNKGE